MYSDLVNILSTFSKKSSARKPKPKKSQKKGQDKDKGPWYTSECRKIKGILNRAEKEYKKDPFNRNKKDILFTARKKLKKFAETLRRSSEKN